MVGSPTTPQSPLSCGRKTLNWCEWVGQWMTAGLGMFCNAFIILAVGNIAPILAHANPGCWGDVHPNCSDALQASAHYAVFAGLMMGMICGGYIGDKFGRRKGSLVTVSIMILGNVLVVSSFLPTDEGIFTMYSIALGIFGFGVGGEYPLTAASTAERAEAERAEREVRIAAGEEIVAAPDRGRKVVLPFTMQGLGNLLNTGIILGLLYFLGQTNEQTYNRHKLTVIWRLQYALGLLPLSFLLFYRVRYLKESDAWAKLKAQAGGGKTRLFFKYYWHRLIGTAGGWCVWDIAFYGNKVFQTQFIKLFVPSASIIDILIYTLINAGIAMVGYYAAAFTIDLWWMGRRRMQVMGFLVIFVCFTVCGIWYDWLTSSAGLGYLQALYYATTFWGQWGPNATTWMFPAEVFPTHIRAVANGISGACGPGLGALLGGLLFSYLDSQVCFFICAGCGLLGVVLTLCLLPDLTHMSLDENDKFWSALMRTASGEGGGYNGDYKNNLSPFERWIWWPLTFGKESATAADEAEKAPLVQHG